MSMIQKHSEAIALGCSLVSVHKPFVCVDLVSQKVCTVPLKWVEVS